MVFKSRGLLTRIWISSIELKLPASSAALSLPILLEKAFYRTSFALLARFAGRTAGVWAYEKPRMKYAHIRGCQLEIIVVVAVYEQLSEDS